MKPRLLIAESDVCLADDYRHFFWKRGFDVETADDGLQCLDMLQQCPPHALILDYDLAWGGGDGVLARMREDCHLTSIPVLVITDSASVHVNGSARHALGGAPVVACFRKPFRMESLWSALSVEIPELATEQFLAEAECLLPLVREQFDTGLLVH
ncbi:MAG: response regulator [Planctomycetota bacterium]|nr:MAG: response regulator [Planctomycetota bacterium]REJ92151.1 MAG: response regulator [Planctomycetota bacterium]REK28687.1 MAG: response regulator [Planctomycetota bacterium]REK39301.1 MAG: response regulator [Planctomycetota bacterium]